MQNVTHQISQMFHKSNEQLLSYACNFIKKDSNTGIFLWILRNF